MKSVDLRTKRLPTKSRKKYRDKKDWIKKREKIGREDGRKETRRRKEIREVRESQTKTLYLLLF